jgi:uncharacterized small protein (DUF1192 family)
MTGYGYDGVNRETRALINELFSDPSAISRGESGELRPRIAELEAEVERLKAHTWEQERAAVVTFLEKRYENTSYLEVVRIVTKQFAEMIERGEHWPEGASHEG